MIIYIYIYVCNLFLKSYIYIYTYVSGEMIVTSRPWNRGIMFRIRGIIPIKNHLKQDQIKLVIYGYGSIPINTIFSGMNIHLPAILMFTRGTRF